MFRNKEKTDEAFEFVYPMYCMQIMVVYEQTEDSSSVWYTKGMFGIFHTYTQHVDSNCLSVKTMYIIRLTTMYQIRC